jgi:hypothetical protein
VGGGRSGGRSGRSSMSGGYSCHSSLVFVNKFILNAHDLPGNLGVDGVEGNFELFAEVISIRGSHVVVKVKAKFNGRSLFPHILWKLM